MIRLGVIGRGLWGKHFPRAAFEAGNCTVTDVAGRDWRRLLDRPIDAFIVATPPEAHLEICTTLLDRKRPVMIEKPMGLSIETAEYIDESARLAGVPILVDHQHLFAPAYEELRARATAWSQAYVVSRGGGLGPERSYPSLWDYGPHDVAMFLGLADGPLKDIRAAQTSPGGYAITLDGGSRHGNLRVWNDRAPKERSITVAHSRSYDRIIYDDLANEKLTFNGWPIRVSPEKPLTRAVRAFADAVKTGRTDWRFGSFGVEVVKVLEEAERKCMEA